MAPAILLCEDPEEPIEIKKSIGMGHIWVRFELILHLRYPTD